MKSMEYVDAGQKVLFINNAQRHGTNLADSRPARRLLQAETSVPEGGVACKGIAHARFANVRRAPSHLRLSVGRSTDPQMHRNMQAHAEVIQSTRALSSNIPADRGA